MSLMLYVILLLTYAQQSQNYRVVFPYTCEAKYSDENWSQPQIIFRNETSVKLHSLVLNYGNNVIEGMKAYRGVDGNIRIYRPDYKYDHLSYGAKRLNMPVLPKKTFLQCLKMLIENLKHYLPQAKTNGSIYMRPNLFETTNLFETPEKKSAIFHLYGSKVPMPVFGGEFPTVCLRVETEFNKNENGSVAYVKSGANYAITYLPNKISSQRGCPSTLWLYKGHICEISIGNIWMVIKKDGNRMLVTPPAEFILAPGSIRDAIFTVAKSKGIKASEALIPMENIQDMVENGELLEIFTSGHYVDITPLTNLYYKNQEIEIPTLDQQDPIYLMLWSEMYSIYFGRIKDVNNWMHVLQ